MPTKYSAPLRRITFATMSAIALSFAMASTSGCKKKSRAAEPTESSQQESPTLRGLQEAQLLAHLPANPVGLVIVDVRQLWTVLIHSLGDSTTRGELRARLGFAVDELGQITELIRYFGRPVTLSAATSFAIAEYGDDGVVLLIDAKVFPELEDGYGPLPVRAGEANLIARRGELLFVGEGERFAEALSFVGGKSDGALLSVADVLEKDPSSLGEWVALSAPGSPSLVKAVFGEGSKLLADFRRRTPILTWVNPAKLALHVGLKGEVSLGFDGEKAAIHHALSAAYNSSFEELEGVINEVPGALQGWTNWLNLIVRGSWSRLDFDDAEPMMWARIQGVDCGSPIRNLWVVGALWSSVNQAVLPALVAEAHAQVPACTDGEACAEAVPSTEGSVEGSEGSVEHSGREYTGVFENVEIAFGESCDGVAGILPELPLNLARLGGDSSNAGVLLLADYGALIRAALPTAFNLLPFALSEASLAEAFGESVMGLSSLRVTDAKMGAYAEVASGSGEKMIFARMPAGLSAVIPPEVRKALTSEAGGMVQLASPGLEARLSNQGRVGWAQVLRQSRADSLVSLTLNRLMLEALSETVERFSPKLAEMFLELEYLTLTIGSDFSMGFTLQLRSESKPNEFVENYSRHLSAAVRDLSKRAEFEAVTGFVPDVVRARFVEAFLTQVRMEARGSSVSVSFGPLGRAMGVGFVGLGFYAALVPQKVFAEGGQIRGPLVPEIRDMRVVPRGASAP